MIDLFASEPQYLAHLAPVWRALRPDERGTCYVLPAVARDARGAGCSPLRVVRQAPPREARPILLAAFADVQVAKGRRYVYVEHGAGQTYVTERWGPNHPSYSGGHSHDRAVLFLCPSERVAERWRAAYPRIPAVAVGSPRLDSLTGARSDRGGDGTPPSPAPTVAVSFHWDATVLCPETRSAFQWYAEALPALAERWRLLGHWHPKWGERLRRWYDEHGIEAVADFAVVARRASVYVADNTSTLFEAAALGIPVVVLNAPWYRRDVEHGGRFWEWTQVGVNVDQPAELEPAVAVALADPDHIRDARDRVVGQVYAYRDGRASQRAAAAIRTVLEAGGGNWRITMPNPYASKQQAALEIPTGRLRRLGATDEQIADARALWESIGDDEKRVELERLARATDDELAEQIALVVDDLAPWDDGAFDHDAVMEWVAGDPERAREALDAARRLGVDGRLRTVRVLTRVANG